MSDGWWDRLYREWTTGETPMDEKAIPRVETTFRVGSKYRVTMTIADGQMTSEWEPHLPRSMSKREWQDYRRGRDAWVAEISKLIGGSVLVVEP